MTISIPVLSLERLCGLAREAIRTAREHRDPRTADMLLVRAAEEMLACDIRARKRLVAEIKRRASLTATKKVQAEEEVMTKDHKYLREAIERYKKKVAREIKQGRGIVRYCYEDYHGKRAMLCVGGKYYCLKHARKLDISVFKKMKVRTLAASRAATEAHAERLLMDLVQLQRSAVVAITKAWYTADRHCDDYKSADVSDLRITVAALLELEKKL